MLWRYRDKAKATAAALLKDENFIIKYPALARALKESVEAAENGRASDTAHQAAAHPPGPREAVSPPSPAPRPQQAGLGKQVGSQHLATKSASQGAQLPPSSTDTTVQAVGQEQQLRTGMNLSPTASQPPEGTTASLAQQPSLGQQAQDTLRESKEPKTATGETTGIAAAGQAVNNAQPEEKSLDPPLHYMKR